MLKVEGVSGGYFQENVVSDVSFHVKRGEFFGILGPNGSGKTTLLKIVSRILKPRAGTIEIKGKNLASFSAKSFAQMVAVLPQHTSDAFSYTVKETVALGRYAHQKGVFPTWTEEDEAIVQEVMKQTGVAIFQDDFLQQLSGGEKQRVFLAQALAQQPQVLLLDEPTNHLDLSYQKDLLDLLRKFADEEGLTIVSIFHDLNLASLYCDRLLLLDQGRVNIVARANDVLKEERVQAVYRTKIEKHPHPKVARPQVILLPQTRDANKKATIIDEKYLTVTEEMIVLRSPTSLRTMSSGVTGSGTGWYEAFVNRHVGKDYSLENHEEEMEQYIRQKDFDLSTTVGMMTAVYLEDVVYRHVLGEGFSVFVVVTAGVANAVDATRGKEHSSDAVPGTINTWIFINGNVAEEAFIQSIMTATEVKVKALMEAGVPDALTGTQATGTSTDSILIAATQQGKHLAYAGSIAPLGKAISEAVYCCTLEAIQKNKARHLE